MVVLRSAAALLIMLTLAVGAASAADSTPPAPTGLHGFLLRADEAPTNSFPRTPAFAWNPIQGAAGYDFQVSISNTFRDNGIVWECPSTTCVSPVAAPAVSLPWIDGIYARVRAIMPDGTKGDWSDPYAFDVKPAMPPTPLPSAPGLLRWTPVPGADGYQVWLPDVSAGGKRFKFETVYTNVLDEREFYTFHQSSSWIGSVRWRIRALRVDWNKSERVNGIPATQYGAWSPTYRSTNPAPTTGPIRLGATVSDIVTQSSSDLGHRLMPAFTWTGNQAADGTSAELFRVYVFSDKACINPVFVSSVVGSPAYAPRPYGGLALPSAAGVAAARGLYLPDGAEPPSYSFDGEPVSSTEYQGPVTPTLPPGGSAGDSKFGAPVSLWDNDSPYNGYYWTVIPVVAQAVNASGSTLAAAAPKGSTTVLTAAATDFKAGDKVQIGSGTDTEVVTVQSVNGSAVTFTAATLSDHAAGEPIVSIGGSFVYQDMELPQDVCAAGRVGTFRISSEPALAAGGDPFATGLSPQGKLTSAARSASFFTSPLVSWTPALGANLYQIEWSKTASPFDPVTVPGGTTPGVMTPATSYVLPLSTPGTWYYRVRGYDWSLPTGAQEMGWSDPAKIEISGAQYKVIKSVKAKPAVKKKPRRH